MWSVPGTLAWHEFEAQKPGRGTSGTRTCPKPVPKGMELAMSGMSL